MIIHIRRLLCAWCVIDRLDAVLFNITIDPFECSRKSSESASALHFSACHVTGVLGDRGVYYMWPDGGGWFLFQMSFRRSFLPKR